MRGKDATIEFRVPVLGITPAYAGKSVGQCRLVLNDYGSPPPMRGKVKIPVVVGYKNRITPAYAGKSPLRTA